MDFSWTAIEQTKMMVYTTGNFYFVLFLEDLSYNFKAVLLLVLFI